MKKRENNFNFQLRTESERLQEQMKKTRLDLGLEKMIQVKPVTEESSNQTEFVNFEMMNPQRNIRKRPYLVNNFF